MYYWNQDNFQGLSRIADAADAHDLRGLAEYCSLRERGLRTRALAVLRDFASELRDRPVADARAAADWIMAVAHGNPAVHQFLAHPLWETFLRPVLTDWMADSESTTPRRWLGIHLGDDDLLREVLERDPSDHAARSVLIRRLLGNVNHATHHLVESHFIGDEQRTLADLQEAERLVAELPDSESRDGLRRGHAELAALVTDWRAFKQEGAADFPAWCHSKKRQHAWSTIVYYRV